MRPRAPWRSSTRAATVDPSRRTSSGAWLRRSATLSCMASVPPGIACSRMAGAVRSSGSMERGLYIAASGMLAEMTRQDQIANDLSNASTPGYKADRSTQQSFGDLLLQNSQTGQQVGALGLGVATDRVVTDLSPAGTRETGEPLDLAIRGEGFFAVQSAQGLRYTRNGQFTASPQGTLMTGLGQQVLGQNGQPVRVN